jgi:hypothetical protein
MYKPKALAMTTPFRLKHRTGTSVNGAMKGDYLDAASPAVRYGEYKPFHGSEALHAGTMQIQDGGTLTTWYMPDYAFSDRVLINDNAAMVYDVISIENVDNRNLYLVMKLRRVVTA